MEEARRPARDPTRKEAGDESRVTAERSSGGGSPDERSLSELTKQLTDQASALRKEIELAKAELALKGKRLGIGAGAFGAAGLFGLYALGALTATAILALAIVLDAWLAALIVAAGYGAIAGILALTGKKKVEEGTPRSGAGDRNDQGRRRVHQAACEGGTAMTEEQRSTEEIREDIEHTRKELGDTAAAVAQKADVKKQAKVKVSDVKEKASAKAESIKETAAAKRRRSGRRRPTRPGPRSSRPSGSHSRTPLRLRSAEPSLPGLHSEGFGRASAVLA